MEQFKKQLLYEPKVESFVEDFANSYIGYVVIKPISGSPIGATLLPSPLQREHESLEDIIQEPSIQIDSIREYGANLMGIPLKVNSLVTQSQDRATSACASIALWSAFHQVGQIFQTPTPAPSNITVAAGNFFNKEGRSFPNSGLSNNQVGRAIASVGLEREMRTIFPGWNSSTFKGFVYGYLRLGLPVLLGVKIDLEELHLIVITGYRFNENWREKLDGKGFRLKADQIQAFYCHDDQLGPFSEYAIHELDELLKKPSSQRQKETLKKTHKAGLYFTSPWPSTEDDKELLMASLDSVIVPVHPLIRIPYERIWKTITILDFILDKGGNNNHWDIFLNESNQLKKELRWYKFQNQEFLSKAFSIPMPKYIWRAQLRYKGRINFELVFDSHGAPESCLLLFAYFPNEAFRQEFGGLLASKYAKIDIGKHLGLTLLKRLRKWQKYTVTKTES
ncbi:MAG: hypothetical protein R3B93_10270 [Bacteroidia bacterium]